MSRTIRSEFAANQLQAARVVTQQARGYVSESDRADWRKVLERRDIRRSNVRNLDSAMRRQRAQMGTARAALLAVVTAGATVAAFIVRLL